MVVLRAWRPEDGEWYVGYDPEIRRFTTESVDTSPEHFRQALAAAGGRGAFARAIVVPETGDLAGNLAADREGTVAEVHYWLAASARGRGLASRALLEAVGWFGAMARN